MSTLIFSATNGSSRQLWKTDGSTGGTAVVHDFGSGFALGSFTDLGNGKMAFTAVNSSAGVRQLWITDGTGEGTVFLKDGITFGSYSSDTVPQLTAIGNGKFLFAASDGSHGSEPWVSDGTAAGTKLLSDVVSGSSGSLPGGFESFGNGKAVFSANGDLYGTDGTAGGTVRLSADGDPGYEKADYALLGNKVVYSAGRSVWVSDGTAAGSKGLGVTTDSTDYAPSGYLALGNGKAIFHSGVDVYATDGTSAVKLTTAKTSFNFGTIFTPLGNGKAIFAMTDAAHGQEVWVTDGTSGGTHLLKDLVTTPTGNGTATDSSSPKNFKALGNGYASFTADNSDGDAHIYVTDGSTVTDLGLAEYFGSANPTSTRLASGAILFSGVAEASGRELWVAQDASHAGNLVKEIVPGTGNDPALQLLTTVPDGSRAVFAASDGSTGLELWVSDGTAEGTKLLRDINPGTGSSNIGGFYLLTDPAPTGAPTDIRLSAATVAEFAATGTSVGTLSATDPDAGDTFTYKLLDDAGGRFALSGNTLKVANGLLLDYEQAASDTVTVRVTDAQGNHFDKVLTLAIKDVNPETITGSSGADTFVGGSGNDTFDGAAGNDTLNGGAGLDRMTGGLGNDIFYVDSVGDTVVEAAGTGSGVDTVRTTLTTYTLAANVEQVVFDGTGAFAGTGNASDNRLTGGIGDDRFFTDGQGSDIFGGGAGTDSVFYTKATTGVVIDLGGTTQGGAAAGDVYGSIEKFFGSNTAGDTMTAAPAGRAVFSGQGGNDVLTGGDNIDTLLGGAGNDTLKGNGAVDILQGGLGNDTIDGGAGRDQFVFAETGFGKDVIQNFEDRQDRLKVFSTVADSISDFAITGNGTSHVVLELVGSTANTITLDGKAGAAITITADDLLFY